MLTLADTLQVLAPRLPAALAPVAAYASTQAAAARLPAALTEWAYLECRLGGHPAPPDLIVEVRAGARGLLTGDDPGPGLAPALAANPVWERVAALARRWADPRSPLHTALYCLWLEFDVSAHPHGAPPLPGVFAGFTPAAARAGTPARRAALAAEALEVLAGGPLDAARRATLVEAHRCLPAGASMYYVGILLPRGTDVLRLCPGDVAARDLPAYLGAVGWPGDVDALGQLLRDAGRTRRGAFAPDPALLHLDLGAQVLPRLGLEMVFDRRAQTRGVLAEGAFMRWLVRHGLCTAPEAAALAGFPGCGIERLPHQLWRSMVMRRVNHVKLVIDGAGPPRAKAYLVLHHRYWNARTGAAPIAAVV